MQLLTCECFLNSLLHHHNNISFGCGQNNNNRCWKDNLEVTFHVLAVTVASKTARLQVFF